MLNILKEYLFYANMSNELSKNGILVGGFMIQKRFLPTILLLFFTISIAFSSEAYDKGFELFSSNRPEEAIPYFLTSLEDASVSPSVYIYLGIAYYQIGDYSKSLQISRQGLSAAGTNKRVIAFNAGNSAYAMRDFVTAEEMYSLAFAADPSFANPVLNRANARLSQQKYKDALDDYINYLVLAPDTDQRQEIEAIIRALQEEVVYQEQEAERLAKEAERLRAEEERMQAEQRRIAEERAEQERILQEKLAAEKAAEAERRRKLLEEVAASLQDTDTTNMNAGSEGVIEYEYESELD